MKVKVSSSLDESLLEKVRKYNLKKLADFKAKGYTKERCYSKLSKVFVDKNY